MGTFVGRIDELADSIGEGSLVTSVEVDQVYAHAQHEHRDWKHPRGGQAGYLSEPLFGNYQDYYRKMAVLLFVIDGLERAAADNAEDLSHEVFLKAPIEYGNLKLSGHPKVTSQGEVVYDRAPIQHRLTEEELRALRQHPDQFRHQGY